MNIKYNLRVYEICLIRDSLTLFPTHLLLFLNIYWKNYKITSKIHGIGISLTNFILYSKECVLKKYVEE